jgi:ABC-type proline/glycine betaine transport system permease subunit
MAGVNQSFSMVVISSMIKACGLSYNVLI